MDSRLTRRRAGSIRYTDRRQFLGVLGVGAVTGIAGCIGSSDDDETGSDGDGDGGSGDDGGGTDGADDDSGSDDGESGGAGDLVCADLTTGYTAYSDEDGAFFSGFEIPTVLADAGEIMPVGSQVWVRAVRPLTADGDAQFHLSVMQANDGREMARELLDGEEAVTEIEFNGEGLTVSKLSQRVVSGVEQLRVSLPYDDGDGTRYYPFTVQLEVENAPGGEVSVACDAAIDEAARHVMESLQPNPDTSFDRSTASTLPGEMATKRGRTPRPSL